MTFSKNANISDFLKAAKRCKGEIAFSTSEGDILNLKSTLSQHLFLSMQDNEHFIADGMLQIENPADYRLLAPYLEDIS